MNVKFEVMLGARVENPVNDKINKHCKTGVTTLLDSKEYGSNFRRSCGIQTKAKKQKHTQVEK